MIIITNKGTGWKLVEIVDEAKYKKTLHYARVYSRSISNAAWERGDFWTNMEATGLVSIFRMLLMAHSTKTLLNEDH